MSDVFTTVLNGISKKFVDLGTHHAEVVVAVGPDGLPIGGGSSSTQTAHYTVSAANAYTLPSLPSTLAGARILFNGVEYADNGVDWSVSGLTLTVINTSISDAIGTEFKFQWS